MSDLRSCPRCENIERLWTDNTIKLCKEINHLRAEVERLKSLWIEYRNATDAGSNYSILAELFKRFDDAIRETE